jgi:ribosome-binding protein aMBF1 (putative translation factor)
MDSSTEFLAMSVELERDMLVLGTVVKQARQAHDLSLRNLATLIDVGYITLHRFERGQLLPTPAERERIAAWLFAVPPA